MAFNIFATATSDIPLANLDANFTLIGAAAAVSTLYPTASTSITYGTAGTTHYLSGTGLSVAGAATVGTTLGVTGTSTMAAINASGLVAMAGAATVGTTLGVTGTSTLSGTVLTGYTLGVGEAGANDALLRLGPTALSANYSSRLNFAASNSVTNWQISANTAASGAGGFAITPSTAGGGTTFSTAALSITSAGAVTIPGTLGVTGATTLSGKLTTSFAGGGDFVAVFTNTTAATPYTVRIIEPAAAVSGYPLLQVVDSAGSTDRFKVMSGTGNTTVGGTLGVTSYATTDAYFWSKGVGTAGGIFLGAAGNATGHISQSSDGAGTTTTYIGNQSITTSSDIRLKKNVVNSTRNATGIINALRVVEHTWDDPSDRCENNRNSRGVWTGLIAQEAIAHIPWLVNRPLADVAEDGTPQYWHMDYGYAVPLLMKAIQELSADFQAYKAAHP